MKDAGNVEVFVIAAGLVICLIPAVALPIAILVSAYAIFSGLKGLLK